MSVTTIEEAIVTTLKADSEVKGITTRVYPNSMPQSPTYPLIVYQKVSGYRPHHLGGVSGVARPRFQIEAWAATYTAAKSLAKAIREALDGTRYTSGTVTFYSLIQGEFDNYEPNTETHRIIQDYTIRHNE